ncbi:MAG: competence/damage-inducible protein A [Acidobacteria bacterium RIFCSPLOWO2_02_FULL_68_18]|nr:MAG: competence/damage-inducible protein A [Acidobacteria bacterium RIFCSPLOWO2_02_FULL_68_18]OFW49533.1 MAG: competence/damage-inducible protein A [Acidobacteria bacterium RIFCSPLOWO2_12_FULL_68_19]
MRRLDRAAILAVGSELLTPSRLDTNSLRITEQLNLIGVGVVFKSVIGDDREELGRAVRAALDRVDVIVCSGGLGPTDDDVTREVVAEVLGRPLAEDERIAARIRARFETRGLRMPDINRRQAMVPAGAIVLENTKGTAPGLWLEEGDRVIVLLPGPPRELEAMLAPLVEGELKARASGFAIVRRTVRVAGRTESHTEEAVRPLYGRWSQATVPVAATILASLGQIELHLSARAASREQAEAAVELASREVEDALGLDAFSRDGRTLEEVVGSMLLERGLRIAVAESCTGGLLTSRLTDVPGSSRYVQAGVVAYANEEKTAILGVPPTLIEAHGAVSEPVAVAMAEGIRTRTGTDIGIGVTGIAGPGGGTPQKPVGTVVVAAALPRQTRSRLFRFVGDRQMVKFQAAQAALDLVRRMLLS